MYISKNSVIYLAIEGFELEEVFMAASYEDAKKICKLLNLTIKTTNKLIEENTKLHQAIEYYEKAN